MIVFSKSFDQRDLPEEYFRDVWRSRDGVRWEKVHQVSPLGHPIGGIGGDGFVLNNKVILPGGFTYDGLVSKHRAQWRNVWRSRSNLGEWELATSNFPARQYSDVGIYDNKVWVIGGIVENALGVAHNSNEIWHSSNGANWTRLKCSPLIPTHASTIWSTPRGLFVGLGNGWSREIWKISRQ